MPELLNTNTAIMEVLDTQQLTQSNTTNLPPPYVLETADNNQHNINDSLQKDYTPAYNFLNQYESQAANSNTYEQMKKNYNVCEKIENSVKHTPD